MCDLLHLVTRLVFRKKCDGIACDILKFLVTSSVSIKRVIVSSDIVTIQSGISVILSYFSVTNNSKKNSLIFVFGVTVSDVVITYIVEFDFIWCDYWLSKATVIMLSCVSIGLHFITLVHVNA